MVDVGFVLGSKSDLEQIDGARAFLNEMGILHEVRVISAHRTPDRCREYVTTAKDRGLKVLVGVAGVAAHLAGVLAAHTDLPVLGVPAAGGPLNGLDALLSTVQMPGGVPVATFAIGKAGATNAAVFAARMLALNDPALARKLALYRDGMRSKVERADDELRGN
ncbi:MAG TPA: 5-(carboxyamino)imidazole ribonucleotide mutase [Planctomycetota bacterium]|nr:5-(carboxyamino)imidazole ribonucleotide mutase [Planctomycetota bacterium]